MPLPALSGEDPIGGRAFNAFARVGDVLNSLREQQLANQYAPLNQAIKTQNALSYSGKMGGINTFLKSISELPVAERQSYLADPVNRKNYMNMMEQYRTAVNSPSGNAMQLITPELLQQAGLSTNQNQLQAAPVPQMESQNALEQQPQQQAQTYQIPQDVQEDVAQNHMQSPYYAESMTQLSPQERNDLTAQMRANNQNIGSSLRNRADNAIAFEKYVQSAQPYLSKAFSDAFKYNQLYGRGKNWLTKFKNDQPEEYANYIFAKNHAVGTLSNGIRFLEQMGVSHEAQEDARRMVADLDKMDVSPDTARRVFNKSINNLSDVSEGVLSSAEPAYPGTRRKLSGLRKLESDYIPEYQSQKKSSQENEIPEEPKKAYGAGTKLLARDIQMPSFNTKEDFQNWYKRQPDMVKNAIRKRLRGE